MLPKQTPAVFCKKIKGTLPHLSPQGKNTAQLLQGATKAKTDEKKKKKKQDIQKTIKAVIQLHWSSSWILKGHCSQIKPLQPCPNISSMCCNMLPPCSDPTLTSGSLWRRPLLARYFLAHPNLGNDRQMVPLAHLLQFLTKGGFCARSWAPCFVYSLQLGIRRVKRGRQRSAVGMEQRSLSDNAVSLLTCHYTAGMNRQTDFHCFPKKFYAAKMMQESQNCQHLWHFIGLGWASTWMYPHVCTM